jgi:hypothetical protein
LQRIQQHFDNSVNDLATGPEGSHMSATLSAVGNLNASALGKTINIETENTLKVFQNYFGPYPSPPNRGDEHYRYLRARLARPAVPLVAHVPG